MLAACEDGMGTAEAAETFAVSASWVRRIRQRFRDQGAVEPRVPARRGPAPALADQSDRLRQLVREHPGLTYKKSPSGRPSRAAPT